MMGDFIRIWYALLFILIFGLFLYDNVWYMEYSLSERDIERETQFFGKIVNISDDHFYLDIGSSNIRIESFNMLEIRKARYGETVVHVIYGGEGAIEGIGYHNYDYNYFLYVLSSIAFVIFLIIFFKEWRFTWRGFENA